jgi:S-adenosylmethionine:tRNA ribosyltransferase-isomerase
MVPPDNAKCAHMMMQTDELNFHLPPELIAQTPPEERSAARLLHYRRSDKSIAHRTFTDLPDLLRPGDLLVFNDSRVLPAKLLLHKPTGGRVEGLFLADEDAGIWRVLLKNLGDSLPPLSFADDPTITMTPLHRIHEGEFRVQISPPASAGDLLPRVGRMPLPPYIKRRKAGDPLDAIDRQRYQTIYAKLVGSVAAPTAGLHFTTEILDRLKSRGVETTHVTLHVGLGTFKPIISDTLESHPMHNESYTLPPLAAAAINRAKHDRRRIVAVGTTAARVLESQPAGDLSPASGTTNIFIYPPYAWRHIGALITNFHLPRSTLIALVAAFVGLDQQRRIYEEAIARRYRFFSYGDTSLLE